MPVIERPLIRLAEISNLLHVSIPRLRKLCALATPIPVPVTESLEFGELLSPAAAQLLIDRVIAIDTPREPPKCHDRVSLLLWMCGLSGKVEPRRRPKPYSASIEEEITRIARLKEPHRTLRALDLLARFCDARVIASALMETRLPREIEVIERKLDELTGGG